MGKIQALTYFRSFHFHDVYGLQFYHILLTSRYPGAWPRSFHWWGRTRTGGDRGRETNFEQSRCL